VRAGVVGAGRWATTLAAKLSAFGVWIGGHSRRGVEPARGMGELVRPWQELIGGSDLIVAATSSPSLNAEIVVECARRGVAVLATKPIDLPEEICRPGALRAPVMVDYVHLFSPVYRALKERVRRSPEIRVEGLVVEMSGPDARRPFPASEDYGSHAAAIYRDLLGTAGPVKVHAARVIEGGIHAALEVGGTKVVYRAGVGKPCRQAYVSRGGAGDLCYSEAEPRASGARSATLTGFDGAYLAAADPHDPLAALCGYVIRSVMRGCTSTYFAELSRVVSADLRAVSLAAAPAAVRRAVG